MKILVTGGGGFLGQALCRRLIERGYDVTSFSRSQHPDLDARQVQGDLADADAVFAATDAMDAVFHVAAKSGTWGRRRDYLATNVVGTRNVIAACRRHGTPKLIYTSTPSVTHRADRPVEGGTAESVPYADQLNAQYPATKLVAEKMVLAADGDQLSTVALRPRLIWGPGDNQLLPRLVERAQAGRLRLVGGGAAVVDTTYVDNAADAHVNALDRLEPGAACAGRAYFISNGEPRPVREILNALLRAASAPEVDKALSFRIAHAVGAVSEAAWRLLRLRGEPPMTRFLAEQLSTTHWYDLAPAQRDLGYRPRVTIDEGLRRLTSSGSWPSAAGSPSEWP